MAEAKVIQIDASEIDSWLDGDIDPPSSLVEELEGAIVKMRETDGPTQGIITIHINNDLEPINEGESTEGDVA